MGNSEFAFLLQDSKDLKHWLAAIDAHNASPSAGEKLTTPSILIFHGLKFLLAHNMGGRQATWSFLQAWRTHRQHVMLGAFNKPRGWRECQDFLWTAANSEDRPNPKIL